jgi:glycerol-3-phosphate O-acyltransferase
MGPLLAGWDAVTRSVNLPLWAVVLLSILASVALLDRLLSPALRRLLRRRTARVIDELNEKLSLRIQPFKLAKRTALIDQLRNDPEVLAAIDAEVATGKPRAEVVARARKIASEVVPSFSATTYFRIGAKLARRVSQSLYRVRLGYADDAALKAVDPNASVVFVINHRSNMDYVVVTYIASPAAALSYAVGEWAQIWPLNALIRSMGAYFIRRNSADPLYRRIVARYVAMATDAGVVQAVFPEGGLSRTGALQPPKLGLLSYMVQGFDPHGPRDIVFIPVGLNYDRVLEDRNLTRAANLAPGEAARFKFNPMVFVRYIAKMLGRKLVGRWYKNGYAIVSFGAPISLKKTLLDAGVDLRTLPETERHATIEHLGEYLMQSVGRVVPALPVPLVATALLENAQQPVTLFELKGRVFELMRRLEQAGHYVHIPRDDRDYAIDVGLRMLTMRRLVVETNGQYAPAAGEAALLQYYAASLAHMFDASVRPARTDAA